MEKKMINKPYIISEEDGAAVVNTTDQIAPVQNKLTKKIMKRKYPKMLDKSTPKFSTIDTRDSKLTENEFEAMRYHPASVMVPLDEECIEYKLLNFDDYGRVFENTVIVNRHEKKAYIDINSKETVNFLINESQKNHYGMRQPEMKHVRNFVSSLTEGYQYVLLHNETEYKIKIK